MERKILVIEDNAEMRENISDLLSIAGYEVFTAENGLRGLEAAKINLPDLILCDIMMPELDGFGVLLATKNLPELAGTPFVFLTARSENADFRKGMNLGATDYLTKPFVGDDLLNVVAMRIKQGRADNQNVENTFEGYNQLLERAKNYLGIDAFKALRIEKKIKKKINIFIEGDSSTHLYFIVSGKIKTYRTNEWGKEIITGIYVANDFFGYHTLFDNSTRKDSAMAMENSEIILITRNDFHKLLFSNHEIALHFIHLMSNNMEEAEQRLLKLAYDSARKRVAEAILFFVHKYDIKEDEWIMVGRDNISMVAGISPESASRNLSDFREEGLIETENGSIRIPDLKRLEKLKY